ncbi:MAG: dephospho-CoA kinase [Gammaproteobacteria bacterium]|nr:dephospho-CoA kinase [Gammaproteobacteria bacterium]MDH4253805.1 dephospho-CoA kinase [Gammaproteobacteria bacterium]MDH5308622.1 dephospho-CoA kinase [Gammaproteobacteria bacterium]
MGSNSRRADRPYTVGLTGGIASGKSTVADMFAALGVPVIDTDVIARQVVEPGQPALAEIRETFGESVIRSDGTLDRQALRAIVFADPSKRMRLESMLHPRIRAEAARQSAAADGPYQIVVVPLLAESPMKRDMDRILVIDCSEEVQLARLLARDNETEAQARRIMASQASREERLHIADDVVRNDGNREETERQVRMLHRRYVELAGREGS